MTSILLDSTTKSLLAINEQANRKAAARQPREWWKRSSRPKARRLRGGVKKMNR